MSTKNLPKFMVLCVVLVLLLATVLTGCELSEPVTEAEYKININSEANQRYQDQTTKEEAVNEFTTSITNLRTYLNGETFVDTGYYMGVNFAIDLLDDADNTVGNFQLRIHAYLYTFPYEDEDGNPIYKYYENGQYYDVNNEQGTRTLVNALEIHNEAIKKSDISIEWYNGSTNETMIGLYYDGVNNNSDDPGNILYADIQGARRTFPDFGDTVLYQQMIRLLVSLSVEGLLESLGLQSDAGTSTIETAMTALIGENYKRVVNNELISLLFYAVTLDSIKDRATQLLVNMFGKFEDKWDPMMYKYLGFRFSTVATSDVQSINADMQSIISPTKEKDKNVLTNAVFDFRGVVKDQPGESYKYTSHITFDYGWSYPQDGSLTVENKDWYKLFSYGDYEFQGTLYVPAWDSQFDALIRTDMQPYDNATNNVFMEFTDIANGELMIGVYYKNERSYLDITGMEYMYGWIDLAYLGFPQVYDEHIDLADALKKWYKMVNNVIVSIVDGILDPASSDKKNKALDYIIAKTSITESIEFSTEDEAVLRARLEKSGLTTSDIAWYLGRQSDLTPSEEEALMAEFTAKPLEKETIEKFILEKKRESLFSANTETLQVDIELIKQMLEETGAGTFTTRQIINILDSVLPYTMDQLAIMLGIPSAELMIEKTYFTFTWDVDTNELTMIMYTNLGVDLDAGEPSNMLFQLELTPTHFGEEVAIADIDFSKFKPLEQIYTYSGTLKGDFVFSSQETVDLSKLLSATFGESSGLNTPYVLAANTGLTFELIYDQFVTDNYVNDDGIVVPTSDPSGVWKREGRSAFTLTLKLMSTDETILQLSSDDVSFNNDVYKKLNSLDPEERSDAEHQMGYIWVNIECVQKNGQQAVPKLKVREDVFMASMNAYMQGQTKIEDNVSSFADNDFNMSLTSIISALCKDAYVVPEPEQMEITSSNETLQSLFRVDGLIGNIRVDAGFTYRVKGLQSIKNQYYMYQVGSFTDIEGNSPYDTELHETLNVYFYEDYRDEYEPLDYDFYVFSEDITLSDGNLIAAGTILIFELGAKKTVSREKIDYDSTSFFADEGADNPDITQVKFLLTGLEGLVFREENAYYYYDYIGQTVQIKDQYVQNDGGTVYILWEGLRDVVFYDEETEYYYYDMSMVLTYKEDDEVNYSYREGDSVYLYQAEYRKLLFEYDPDVIEVTASCKKQYAPRTNGSFMGVVRRYYAVFTARKDAELGALHSVYYDSLTTWPPQYYSPEDRDHVTNVYDDDGKLTDSYYDPIALFVMEPAEPLSTSAVFNVCTDKYLKTDAWDWTVANADPHQRCKWESTEYSTFNVRFVIDWDAVTLKGYVLVTEVIVAEGMMGETSFPCRLIITNREIDTSETAVVYDEKNYTYEVVDSATYIVGDDVPADTYYELNGETYSFTTDKTFRGDGVYYKKVYYAENVPVVDSIDIDPYEYILAKYEYMIEKGNFNQTAYLEEKTLLEKYAEVEQQFINDYFAKYVFEIYFKWETSYLNTVYKDAYYAENLIQEPYIDPYIAHSYTNDTGAATPTRYNWSFDAYEYGTNLEKSVKPTGGYVYVHTRFYGQLIALRVNVGVRNFSYIKFNVYDADGELVSEDKGYSAKAAKASEEVYDVVINGKYSANYYDESSYKIGTQPTFVFTDENGNEHELLFDMTLVTGLDDRSNYLTRVYSLLWSDDTVKNVGTKGSYYYEYTYTDLYKDGDDFAPAIKKVSVLYESTDADAVSLTAEERAQTVRVADEAEELPLYREAYGYTEVRQPEIYMSSSATDASTLYKTYKGEKVPYVSLTDEMRAKMVLTLNGTYQKLYYQDGDGYAHERAVYLYSDRFEQYGKCAFQVMYQLTERALLSAEVNFEEKVPLSGGGEGVKYELGENGYALQRKCVLYSVATVALKTAENESVPYIILTAAQKALKVTTADGEKPLYTEDGDGMTAVRTPLEYSDSKFDVATVFTFVNNGECDLTGEQLSKTVAVYGGKATLPLFREKDGVVQIRKAYLYLSDSFLTITVDGSPLAYSVLSADTRKKTVSVFDLEGTLPLYDRNNANASLRLGYVYTDEWEDFVPEGEDAEGNPKTYTWSRLSAEMQNMTVTVCYNPEQKNLYRSSAEGYVTVRSRLTTDNTVLPDVLAEEYIYVEYGGNDGSMGKAYRYKTDKNGNYSVRSEETSLINRPFYGYYDGETLVYKGSGYTYTYEETDVSYASVRSSVTYVIGDDGETYPSYKEGNDGIALKRKDLVLDSRTTTEITTSSVNLYYLLRFYVLLNGDSVPFSVLTGAVVTEEESGGASKTGYPIIDVRAVAECPTLEPVAMSSQVTDQLNENTLFTVSKVKTGKDADTSDSCNELGYYKVDPLRPSTTTLPSDITVYFQDSNGRESKHTFTDIEWCAYFDESKNQHTECRSDPSQIVVQQAEDGSYVLALGTDKELTTSMMTRVGNETSGYIYITVALKILSKNPKEIVFRKQVGGEVYAVEKETIDILKTDGSVMTSYAHYFYQADTFKNIVLPGCLEATFSDNRTVVYEDVEWHTTDGSAIVFKPNTLLHLVSVITDSKEEGKQVELSVYLDVIVKNNGLKEVDEREANLELTETTTAANYYTYVDVSIDGEEDKKVNIKDLVQWDSDEVGLYYKDAETGKLGYVVIGTGDTGRGEIQLYEKRFTNEYQASGSMTVETFIETFFSGMKLNLVEDAFDYSTADGVVCYRYNPLSPDTIVPSVTATFDKFAVRYENGTLSVATGFTGTDGDTYCIYTEDNAIVIIKDGQTANYSALQFNALLTDFISARIEQELSTDIRTWYIDGIYPSSAKTATYLNKVLDTTGLIRTEGKDKNGFVRTDNLIHSIEFERIELRHPQNGNIVTIEREEFDYRYCHLCNFVDIDMYAQEVAVTKTELTVNDLESVMNVNDMIGYEKSQGVIDSMTLEEFRSRYGVNAGTGAKYTISVGTGRGAYDLAVNLVFAEGFYNKATFSPITVYPYDETGSANYSSGYNIAKRLQYKIEEVYYQAPSYTNKIGTAFSYNIVNTDEKLTDWYIESSTNNEILAEGQYLEDDTFPASLIYKAGSWTLSVTVSCLTSQGFRIRQQFNFKGYSEEITAFSGQGKSGSNVLTVTDGAIVIENIYDYYDAANPNALREYFCSPDCLPTTVNIPAWDDSVEDGQAKYPNGLTVANIRWEITTLCATRIGKLTYEGFEKTAMAEAYILGYYSAEQGKMIGQVKLTVTIRIMPAKVEVLPWEDTAIGLTTATWMTSASARKFNVYFDAYNNASSSVLLDESKDRQKGVLYLPSSFVGTYENGGLKNTFHNVTYVGGNVALTKIYYDMDGIDLKKTFGETKLTQTNKINLKVNLGLNQILDLDWWFFDKSQEITEPIYSVTDEEMRSVIADNLEEVTDDLESELYLQINTKRLQANLERLMAQAQAINSVIQTVASAEKAEELVSYVILEDIAAELRKTTESIAENTAIDLNALPTDDVWSNKQCERYALVRFKEKVQTVAAVYAQEIYAVNRGSASATKKKNNIRTALEEFVAELATETYNTVIRDYITGELSSVFYSYMEDNISDDQINNAVIYKNAIEGAFDTENFVRNIEKLRNILSGYYSGADASKKLAFTVRQFDLTYARKYGNLGEPSSVNDLIKGLVLEEFFRAVFAADQAVGVRTQSGVYGTDNTALATVRQTVLQTAFIRFGLSNCYYTYATDNITVDTPVYYMDENGMYALETGEKTDGVVYYRRIAENDGDKENMQNITGLAENGTVAIPSGITNLNLDALVTVAVTTKPSGKEYLYSLKDMRMTTYAFTERWFDFSEAKLSDITAFYNMRKLLIESGFASLRSESIGTIRRSLVNGIDFGTTLENLLRKGISDFLENIYTEDKYVTSIKEVRKLNGSWEEVFVLPTSDYYIDNNTYYSLTVASEFTAGKMYEQNEYGSYVLSEDATATAGKIYYTSAKITKDIRYLPVTLRTDENGLSAWTCRVGSAVGADYYEIVYEKTADLTWQADTEYYEKISDTQWSLSRDTAFDAGKEYYEKTYRATEDAVFQMGKQYYYLGDAIELLAKIDTVEVYKEAEELMFSGTEGMYYGFTALESTHLIDNKRHLIVNQGDKLSEIGYNNYATGSPVVSHDYYQKVGSSYVKVDNDSGLLTFGTDKQYYSDNGVEADGKRYYEVYVNGDTKTAYAYTGSTAGTSYYRTWGCLTDGTYGYYLTNEYYEKRGDGTMYRLSNATVLNKLGSYYLKTVLRSGTDYTVGTQIADAVKKGKSFYTKVTVAAYYNKVALYRADGYYLYNAVPSLYNITATEGYAYTYSAEWENALTKIVYSGGQATLSGLLTDGTAEDGAEGKYLNNQRLTVKVEVNKHILSDDELVVTADPIEKARAIVEGTATEADGYEVKDMNPVVRLTKKSTKEVYVVFFDTSGATPLFTKMYGYDSEGYVMYSFENNYNSLTKKLVNQTVNVYNPFEFDKSDLPSMLKVDGSWQTILWSNVSINPEGNLDNASHTVQGHIFNADGQSVTMELYVASWIYRGLYEEVDEGSSDKTDIVYAVDGVNKYFTYMGSLQFFFSNYTHYSARDYYLAYFTVRMYVDGKVQTVHFNKTVGDSYGDVVAADDGFMAKLFYPSSQSSSGGVEIGSRLLEYGTQDSTMLKVRQRQKYLLYWNMTALSSLLSDTSHRTYSGNISFGNASLGSYTLRELRESGDEKTPVTAYYMYENMDVDTVRVMPASVTVTAEVKTETKNAITEKTYLLTVGFPYCEESYSVTVTETESTYSASGTCSCGGTVIIDGVHEGYTMRCGKTDCPTNGHTVYYKTDAGTAECLCELCTSFRSVEESLTGSSGQITVILGLGEDYPMTGTVKLKENHVHYAEDEINVRYIWAKNFSYTTAIRNLKDFVGKKYGIESSTQEIYALNLLMNWTEMSESEQNDVIDMAIEYYRDDMNYMEEQAKKAAYNLLFVHETYDFENNPTRLSGGGDANVPLTLLIRMEGESTLYLKTVYAKVIFKDYSAQQYYTYDRSSQKYNVYTVDMSRNEVYLQVDSSTVSKMEGQVIPKGQYFLLDDETAEYYSAGDGTAVFDSSKQYYRLRTDSCYIGVHKDYWYSEYVEIGTVYGESIPTSREYYTKVGDEYVLATGATFGSGTYYVKNENAPSDLPRDTDYYTYHGKTQPYDTISEDLLKLLNYACHTADGDETDGYALLQVENILWTYNSDTNILVSSEFSVIVGDQTYTFESQLLTMTLTR